MGIKLPGPTNYVFSILVLLMACTQPEEEGVVYDFSDKLDRIWIGPDFWANRLQDWHVSDGKIICNTSSAKRNVQILTYNLDSTSGSFSIRVNLGLTEDALSKTGWIGMKIAVRGEFGDFRDDAIYGKGIDIGVTTDKRFFLDDISVKLDSNTDLNDMILETKGFQEDHYNIRASLFEGSDDLPIAEISTKSFPGSQLSGNIGIVSDFSNEITNNQIPSAWFDNIMLDGEKIVHNPEHAYGPVLFTQHTLSKSILKMSAQLPPVGRQEALKGRLELYDSASFEWITHSESILEPDSRTLSFRVSEWNHSKQVPYRILYNYLDYDGIPVDSYFEGLVQPDPIDKEEIKVAAFTGNNDLGFPDNDLIENVKKHDADLYFFSGDQIYERVGGFGVQREPVEMAMLDYLRKWYQFGWIYRDLIRSKPSIAIPDDHDVFHGNIWGANGKATPQGLKGNDAQDQGGYKMPARFVNMVQRTQTSHLPDPYDPAPVQQDIGVYYTDLTYGGISFAILEDRKFKSAPTPLLPQAMVWNGWAQNPDFDPKLESDHTEAELLGNRQLEFLEQWAADWSDGIWMKAVLSQTIFANVATLPVDEVHDQNVPKLRILKENEYAPNDRLVADMDSNGWPKSGRDEALRKIRKAFAVHIAGDQHLGSTIQYGIDNFGDAGYAICVPSVSNIWPRRWYPPYPGLNRNPMDPKYTGDYEDGFGNKITVMAVSNPVYTGREPSRLYDRATGYGIITFHKNSRDISMSNWPRDVDPMHPDASPYSGWPVRVNQLDNFHPVSYGSLPTIEVSGMENPVIQIIDEETDIIVYTIRIPGNSFKPHVYKNSSFKLRVGEPGINMKEYSGLIPGDNRTITINF